MAHAGTRTDLAQQPATSTNGLWQALFAVIVILAIAAGMVFVGTNVASSTGVATPAVDHRLDAIEAQRGGAALSGVVAPDRRFDELMLAPVSDGSYTQVENNRGGALTIGSQAAPGLDYIPGGNKVAPGLDYIPGGNIAAPGTSGTVPNQGPGTSGFIPDYGPATSGTVPGYGPGRILGHRAAEIDQ